jgi:hypothetical protein
MAERRDVRFRVVDSATVSTISVSKEQTVDGFRKLVCERLKRRDLADVCINNSACDGEDLLFDFLESDSDVIVLTTLGWVPPPADVPEIRLFTNCSIDGLMSGSLIPLSLDVPFETGMSLVFEHGRAHFRDLPRGDLAATLFLPGGVPWTKGRLSSYLQLFAQSPSYVIYAVFHRRGLELDVPVEFPLSRAASLDRGLVSPLFDASDDGRDQMVCALAFLRLGKSPRIPALVQSFAFFIHFGPLIVALSLLTRGCPVNGRWIVAITATEGEQPALGQGCL